MWKVFKYLDANCVVHASKGMSAISVLICWLQIFLFSRLWWQCFTI